MPFENCVFLPYPETPHPVLPIIIYNPHTGKSVKSYGVIDTGADECAIPAWVAGWLGHSLEKGKETSAASAAGMSSAYSHTTTIEIFQKETEKEARYTLENIPIDYMPHLDVVLLGVRSFLDRFILTIDYPRHRFSIKYPAVDTRGI